MDRLLIKKGIKYNRIFAWILVLLSAILIVSGYLVSKKFLIPISPLWFFARGIHFWIEWIFIAVLFFHFFISEIFVRFSWKFIFRNVKNRKISSIFLLKLIQKITSYFLIIFIMIIVISGLNWYIVDIGYFISFINHLKFDLYVALTMLIHICIGAKIALTRRNIKNSFADYSIIGFFIVLLGAILYFN